MKKICKYPINTTIVQSIELPRGAQFLSLQTQRSIPSLWFLVDDYAETHVTRVIIVGTGFNLDNIYEDYVYLGTYQESNGEFVWHVFLEII